MNLRTKYINLRPVVILTAGLILGILAVYTIKFSSAVFGAILLSVSVLSLLALLIYFVIKKQKLLAVFIGVLILCVGLGSLSTCISIGKTYTEKGYSEFNGTVTEIYSETATDNNLVYSLVIKGDFLSNKNTKVYAKITTGKRLFIGSRIKFNGYFTPFNDNEFSFSSGTHYYTEVDNFVVVYEVEGVFNKIKYNLFNSYDRFASETSGINYAIITGDTQYVDICLPFQGYTLGFYTDLYYYLLKTLKSQGLQKL